MTDSNSPYEDTALAGGATPASLTDPARPGDSFGGGRYRIERPLGVGGQKIVYLVHDTSLDRLCALSLARPEHLEPAQLERFRLEAKALARFGAHANIVTIFDLGEENGVPYVLCEYLEGGDLRAALRTEPTRDPVRALRIAGDICSALCFAHERGVVHRDVTPGNVWLVGDGTAKLGDFGLALVTGQSRLTIPGGVLGTASYVAPEQALGRKVDPRTDLYALGCVLYEMLTGAPPFVGDTAMQVISQHVHALPVAPDERHPPIGPKISALVMRLLQKDPADRPQSARELAGELDRLVTAMTNPPDVGGSPCPIPDDERGRLGALHAFRILDTPEEHEYDELAELAAQICECPMGYVCFVDETRQWMKARYGIPVELKSAPREIGLCQTTICQGDVLVAPDLTQDDRFRNLPPVNDPPNVRFYCGVPLMTSQGHAVGTLCVMDVVPRQLGAEKLEALRVLGRQVMTRLELLRTAARLDKAEAELAEAQGERGASERTTELLHQLLPPHVAGCLLENRAVEPRYHEAVTVGFAQLRDFSRLTSRLQPAELVRSLDAFFSAFDAAIQRLGLEKVKSLGGAYVFAAGVPESSKHHPVEACLGALALRALARELDAARDAHRDNPWQFGIGLHTGPVVAGVVGTWKLGYEICGPGATVAAEVEAAAPPDAVLLSESTYQRVHHLFECRALASIEVENRGPLRLYALERIKPELSSDPEGVQPNAHFYAVVNRRMADS